MKEAKSIGVCLHIWEKKEIENYLLSPSAIFRILERNTRTSNLLTIQIIEKKLDKLTEGMKTETTDKFADEIQSKNRKWQPSTVNKEARKFIESQWDKKMDMISGKELISKFNNWSNSQYKASLSVNGLARELRRDEIASEIKSIITAIEKNQRF